MRSLSERLCASAQLSNWYWYQLDSFSTNIFQSDVVRLKCDT